MQFRPPQMSTFISPRSSRGAWLCASLLLSLLASGWAFAQDVKATFAPAVTASAAPEQARFLAPGEVVQMRLEVFAASGARLYDSDFRAGNLLDWNWQDQQGQRLSDGAYHCLLTVKDVAGRASQRQGLLLVQAGEPAWQPPEEAEAALRTANPSNATERVAFLTIVPTDARLAATALAHNGSEGRLLTGSGGLSVRTGDFFTGKEREQLRLTAEGKLGLGVADPQAKLDVAGPIRTSEGILFPDGTIQTTAFVASGRSLSERAHIQRDAQGRSITEAGEPSSSQQEARLAPTGTFNRVAKFAADGVSLIDSAISDVGGNVGVGTTNPQSGFDYRGSSAAFYTRDIGPSNALTAQSALQLGLSNAGSRFAGVGPSMLFFGENTAGAKSFLGRVSGVWENPTAGAEAGALFFQTRANSGDANALTERMRITSSGRVGIGTNAPVGQLEVVNHSAYSMVNTAYGVGNLLVGRAAGGSQTAPTATTNGQNLLFVGGNGHTGGGFTLASSAAVNLEASQTWTNTANGARITFGTTENGTNNRVERMRIEHNGNVAIGTNLTYAKLSVINSNVDASSTYGAIYGQSNYFGVVGVPTGFDGAGIWGQSLDTNLAGYFTGNVEVSEMLSKGGGSFKIDHPLDPENKYLSHSFVESPDMKNIYDGTVTTDAMGEAEIVLPAWFEALNRDFRYQLTVIGQFAQAIVAEKIKDNRFKIRTSLPQVEVCWQVTGIRQDAFAEQHRIPVEELKPKRERGSYLHPAAFGLPAEKSVEWARHPEMMQRMKEARERANQSTPPVPESDRDRQ